MIKLRVLVACEFSGIVRDAFIRKGHDAVSCDLLPNQKKDGTINEIFLAKQKESPHEK